MKKLEELYRRAGALDAGVVEAAETRSSLSELSGESHGPGRKATQCNRAQLEHRDVAVTLVTLDPLEGGLNCIEWPFQNLGEAAAVKQQGASNLGGCVVPP